ncbi:MAG: hypothetical protein K2V38_28350 [Gemmataceae bacterium]|nr:hypothetical protein [Gemmataceae bacterium]
MHNRLIVTLDAEPDDTSDDVRHAAYNALTLDPSFCGAGGRFCSPLADGFVLGGRWTGYLAEARMAPAYRAELLAAVPALAGRYFDDRLIQEHAETLCRIWLAHGGTGPHPLVRDHHAMLGADDDAQPVTPELLATVLAPYVGGSECYDSGGCDFADLDGDDLTAEAVGRKWAVVVDYHN